MVGDVAARRRIGEKGTTIATTVLFVGRVCLWIVNGERVCWVGCSWKKSRLVSLSQFSYMIDKWTEMSCVFRNTF